MLVERARDAAAINGVLADPAVRPWVTVPGAGELDMTDVVADPRNHVLMADGGGLIFHWQEPGVYEVHTQFRPDVRGGLVVRATQDALWWMFTHTDCMELLTKVPLGNVAARALVKRIGGVLECMRPNVWPTAEGRIGATFWAMRYPDWVANNGRHLEAAGRVFAERMPIAAHDEPLLIRLGAFSAMLRGGQPAKAVTLFNRWARFACAPQVDVVSETPLRLAIGGTEVPEYLWKGQ